MLLRHGTPHRNLPGIRRAGLLCSFSRGRLPVVWLHSPSKTPWAVLHTVKRHGGRVEGVVVIELDVPRRWLRRSKPGLWYTPRDVPSERIRGLTTFAALARSPANEKANCRAAGGTERRHLARQVRFPVPRGGSHFPEVSNGKQLIIQAAAR